MTMVHLWLRVHSKVRRVLKIAPNPCHAGIRMSIKVDSHGYQKNITYPILKYDYDYQKKKHSITIYNHGSEAF
jgi:hypothetical protein